MQRFEILTMVNQRGMSILLVEQFVPLAFKDDPDLVASYLGGAVPEVQRDAAGEVKA